MKSNVFFTCLILLCSQAQSAVLQWYPVQKSRTSVQLLKQNYPTTLPQFIPLKYTQIIDQTAQRYALDPLLLHAVVSVESGYRVDAISNKGAVGLMQVMPTTAARFGSYSLFLPGDNINAGAAYLNMLMKRFDGQLELVLASYNAGEGAVMRYGKTIPPYPETQQYVRRVLKNYDSLRQQGGVKFTNTANTLTQEKSLSEKPEQVMQEKKIAFRATTNALGDAGVLWRFYSGISEEKQTN